MSDRTMGHIAFLLNSLNPGGSCRVAHNLRLEFIDRGLAVEVLAPSSAPETAEAWPWGINVRHIGKGWGGVPSGQLWRERLLLPLAPGKLRHRASYAGGFARYLLEKRPAGVIAFGTYMNLVALWGAALAGTSSHVLATERSNIVRRLEASGAGAVRRWALGRLCRQWYPRAQAVVTVSQGMAEELRGFIAPATPVIQTIYNPIVTSEMCLVDASAAPDAWLGDPDAPVLVSAGRLVPQKGFGLLLEAFTLLNQRRPCRLIILGDGPELGPLKVKAQRLGLLDRVRFPGWVSDPYAYFRHADLFVLTSQWEGFGNVVVEALACGCPVVSVDCPTGPREILDGGSYGRLVGDRRPGTLARAMEAELTSPTDPQRLRERAAAFSISHAADQYLEALGLTA